MVSVPGTEETNIKDHLWDEILQPGAAVQVWSTPEAAEAKDCVPGATAFGGSCGHSFIFGEYVYAEESSPPATQPTAWHLFGSSGTPLDTHGRQTTQRKTVTETYTVQEGENDETVLANAGYRSLAECKDKNKGNPLFKRGGGDAWFFKGAVIIKSAETTEATALTEMADLQLVGMRVIDQRGYHFIPRNPAYINDRVLPDNRARVNWLAGCQVWYAAQLT
jgi:hypothetical protein